MWACDPMRLRAPLGMKKATEGFTTTQGLPAAKITGVNNKRNKMAMSTRGKAAPRQIGSRIDDLTGAGPGRSDESPIEIGLKPNGSCTGKIVYLVGAVD
jgi:hypothetical protein